MTFKPVLLLPLAVLLGLSTQEASVREIRLRVDTVSVEILQTLLPAAVSDGAHGDDFVVFAAGPELWTVDPSLRVTAPRPRAGFPDEANHFTTACSAGARVVVQVSSYPDSIRKEDEGTPRGGFRRGPTPMGVALLTRDGMRYIESFRVVERWPDVQPEPGDTMPTEVTPLIQSCQWTGRELVVGAYGFTAALDLDRATARLLTLDGEMSLNRPAVLLVGDTLWTAEDEGGAAGGCVKRKVRGEPAERYCLMGYNNADLGIDKLMPTRWGLMSSSAAGLVEIRAKDSGYTHYQLSDDRHQMAMYAARCARGALLGVRDDGLAIVEPGSRRAKLVRIGDGSQGRVFAVEQVGRHWLVGTDSGVVRVRLPLPGWRPWRRRTC